MKRKLFAIPSLLAAGFLPFQSQALPLLKIPDGPRADSKSIFDVFRLTHHFILAGHRSHSSHSSHSSHVSHRSSTGGYAAPRYAAPSPTYLDPLYSAPAPRSVPPAPDYTAPAQPQYPALTQPVVPRTLRGNTEKFKEIVEEVQFAMMAFGYYQGPIDGVFGNELRASLRKMQEDYGLKVTGTITPQTLDALKIVAR
ncbi:His-Xaa-Ser repeat protein HxsA [Candidatus Phyllobacterium onerii]|uniref:His-Xaa-Ser repeat protein HxsA n=1 Tax=Candidatus Phyllobacterium onerii TaxID=3020828 RepID=UPI00232BC7E8|nr:His-Xaa-Ser repeat protein HxsA [Phyllobacterium sp. IY22]